MWMSNSTTAVQLELAYGTDSKLHDTVISMITEWLDRVHGWFVQKSIRMD